MASYYYLMAQLPSIMPHTDPPLSYAQFKELALRFLTEKDAAVLETLTLVPPREAVHTTSTVVNEWYAFEQELRFALEQMRASKLKREERISPAETPASAFDIGAIVRGVSNIDDPLAVERYLLNARLAAADQLRKLHFYDSEAVFGYGIVLLLSERASKFKMETGRTEYHSIYTQILGETI